MTNTIKKLSTLAKKILPATFLLCMTITPIVYSATTTSDDYAYPLSIKDTTTPSKVIEEQIKILVGTPEVLADHYIEPMMTEYIDRNYKYYPIKEEDSKLVYTLHDKGKLIDFYSDSGFTGVNHLDDSTCFFFDDASHYSLIIYRGYYEYNSRWDCSFHATPIGVIYQPGKPMFIYAGVTIHVGGDK